MHAFGQVRPGTQAGERPDHGTRSDRGPLDMAERPNFHVVGDAHIRPEDHIGPDHDITAKLCVP